MATPHKAQLRVLLQASLFCFWACVASWGFILGSVGLLKKGSFLCSLVLRVALEDGLGIGDLHDRCLVV